ncbi:glycine betaine ABC transporter substrate-binding protein [Anaerobacillus sp. MEB173]|uniref:glycine betaine ABC transporter substrate-binding protein n=1 Tax=Anaerobacillus sp. MEB173 TaxID=3383345 RepID=UPI003F93D023
MKNGIIIFLLLLPVVLITACNTQSGTGTIESKGTINIGGTEYTEQLILVKITSILLEENGFRVEETINLESDVAVSALEQGQIDMYWVVSDNTEGRVEPLLSDSMYSNDLHELISELTLQLSTDTIIQLIYQVDKEHKGITEVSRAWLEETGLIK